MGTIDTIIKNGCVIDPKNGLRKIAHVGITDGRICYVGDKIPVQATDIYDATGCIVTPGLIDCHVHCYEHATPLGINPDESCLSRGVTTVVDAGSAGASTFPGLRKFIAERSKTRVLCFLHVVLHGLASGGCALGAGGGELDSLNQLDIVACEKCLEKNRDMIVGFKLRLADSLSDGGRNEKEAYRRSLSMSESCKVPLMVHHTFSTVPVQRENDSGVLACPGDMKKGDIYTHMYNAHMSCIVDPTTRSIHKDVIDAKRRGVLFDIGHGHGSFSWAVAEICGKQKFWPDIISTDLHNMSEAGPAYDLPSVMSKLFHVGMPLDDVIKAATSTPADAIGWGDRIGSLTIGFEADVTVLKLEECDIFLEDSQSQLRKIKKRFIPKAVWRSGIQHSCDAPSPFPNPKSIRANLGDYDNAVVRDDVRPVF
ncbi:hypothetical protein ScPMuIL_009407 [Solemya velum]